MPSTTLLRSGLVTITSAAVADLEAVWRLDDPQKALEDVLDPLIGQYGTAAAALAADWYDELRDEREIKGRFTAIPAENETLGVDSLIRWASVQATGLDAFKSLVVGGSQRRISNFARDTLTGSSLADPRARGWVRVGRGECAWCRKYLDGEVRSVAYDFHAHDNCHCTASPVWA